MFPGIWWKEVFITQMPWGIAGHSAVASQGAAGTKWLLCVCVCECVTRCQIPGNRKLTGGKITAAGGPVFCQNIIQWTLLTLSPPPTHHTHTQSLFSSEVIFFQEAGPAAASLLKSESRGKSRIPYWWWWWWWGEKERVGWKGAAMHVGARWGSSAVGQLKVLKQPYSPAVDQRNGCYQTDDLFTSIIFI